MERYTFTNKRTSQIATVTGNNVYSAKDAVINITGWRSSDIRLLIPERDYSNGIA